MTLALIIFGLWLLANLFAIALCKASARNGDDVWPELVDEEGRR